MELDYKKLYEELVQRARELHKGGNALTKKQMEIVCPELAESEDERVNEEIRNFLIDMECKREWIAYLEKQKEQKPKQSEMEKEYVRTLHSLISDFLRGKQEIDREYYQKIWDWLDNRHIEQKPDIEICPHFIKSKSYSEQKPAEWSKEDESNLQSCIAKIEIDMQHWLKHGKTMVDGDIKLIDWLKALPERFELQPKQEWSVDDEIIRDSIIDYINSGNIYATSKVNMITWLKCLRPQQLGIDVEKLVDWAKSNFRISSFDNTKIVTDFSNMTELSDSLREYAYTVFRPQSQWKPSEEQMEALLNAEGLVRANNYPENAKIIASLYEQLKKL